MFAFYSHSFLIPSQQNYHHSSFTGGQWNGDLTISSIKYDSITKIDYTETIPVQFINPETNAAIGLQSGGSCTAERRLTWQSQNGGDDQSFYVKRITGASKWEIHSKSCPGMILEIGGGVCEVRAPIQLSHYDEYNILASQRWKFTKGKIESAKCEGMVIEASTVLPPDPIPDKATLKAAVTSYVNEGCVDDPNCAIGKKWGRPMNIWNVGDITDFSELFKGMTTFNENIAAWDTSKVSTFVCVCISGVLCLISHI